MRRILIIMLITWSGLAWGTTYYVSSSTGSDANGGTAMSAAWQTIAHVNGQAFLPGDSILFRRGDVWNESLAPASSGSSGSPITFDAYGAGAAPNLTGYCAGPARCGKTILGGDKQPIEICWDALPRRRSVCHGWHGHKITFSDCTTAR